MSQYIFLTSLVVMVTQLSLIESQSTFNTERQINLYKKLCYDPTELSSETVSLKRFDLDSTKEGWVVPLTDAVIRNHFGTLMKGETLKLEDNYEDMCLTISKAHTHNETTEIGYFHGFGRQRATIWNCKPSLEFSGVYRCNLYSTLNSKYRADVFFYYTDTKKEDLYVSVHCFSNGEIGWLAAFTKPTLTEAENEAVRNQVAALGFSTTDFPNTDIVRMHGCGCNSTTEIDRGVKLFKI